MTCELFPLPRAPCLRVHGNVSSYVFPKPILKIASLFIAQFHRTSSSNFVWYPSWVPQLVECNSSRRWIVRPRVHTAGETSHYAKHPVWLRTKAIEDDLL